MGAFYVFMATLSSKSARVSRRIIVAAVALSTAAVLSACSASSTGATGSGTDEGLTKVTFALSYLPDISLNGTDIRTALIAMAAGSPISSLMALYQHEPYVLTTLASDGYTSPADLAGKSYGGFGSPMELAVVNDMIADAGGTTPAESVTLSVAAFDALSSGRVDSVLAFPGDNFAFEQSGTEITTFDPLDYGVPDDYASLVLTNDAFEKENPDTVTAFMKALQAGYAAALADPTKADEYTLAERRSLADQRRLDDRTGHPRRPERHAPDRVRRDPFRHERVPVGRIAPRARTNHLRIPV
jgi:ABC-type nitrate/sulfonate/bicarbonate transport system substrate-binding protein